MRKLTAIELREASRLAAGIQRHRRLAAIALLQGEPDAAARYMADVERRRKQLGRLGRAA